MRKLVTDTSFVRMQVAVTKNGLPYDPTGDVVTMAFPLPGIDPQPSDWKTSSWEVVSDGFGNPIAYYAICLVGPGSGAAIDLAAGTYDVYAAPIDTPETPQIKSTDQLLVY